MHNTMTLFRITRANMNPTWSGDATNWFSVAINGSGTVSLQLFYV